MKEYGEGWYIEKEKVYKGKIVVDKNRLYLRGAEDYVDTYVPLEKIDRIRKRKDGLEIHVRLSQARAYTVFMKGQKSGLFDLIESLVEMLNLKKRFFKSEWIGEVSWR